MRIYNRWAGNPGGTGEDPERCVASVFDGVTYMHNQCWRRRVKGPDGLFCKQHAHMIEDGKHVYTPEDE